MKLIIILVILMFFGKCSSFNLNNRILILERRISNSNKNGLHCTSTHTHDHPTTSHHDHAKNINIDLFATESKMPVPQSKTTNSDSNSLINSLVPNSDELLHKLQSEKQTIETEKVKIY